MEVEALARKVGTREYNLAHSQQALNSSQTIDPLCILLKEPMLSVELTQ